MDPLELIEDGPDREPTLGEDPRQRGMGEGRRAQSSEVADDPALPVVGIAVRHRDPAQHPHRDRVDEIVLVGHMPVQRHGSYPETLGERRHRDGVESLLVEQLQRSLDDAVTRQGVTRHPACPAEDETLTAGLARLGYRPTDVTTAIISHLHQDHIGGVREIPDAELVVSAEEWRSLHRPLADARGLLRGHIDVPGLKWSPVELAPLEDPSLAPFTSGRDLFGDGSLVLLPTPGHTPGSMSMLVRRPAMAPLLLVGDLTYDVHAFERGLAGGVGSQRQLRRTRDKVLALRGNNPELQILAAHDPAAAGLLDAAQAVAHDLELRQ